MSRYLIILGILLLISSIALCDTECTVITVRTIPWVEGGSVCSWISGNSKAPEQHYLSAANYAYTFMCPHANEGRWLWGEVVMDYITYSNSEEFVESHPYHYVHVYVNGSP